MLTIAGVDGLPEIERGADLARLVHERHPVLDGDVVVVTSKVVSKAEGCTVELDEVDPSPFAVRWAAAWDKDPRVVEVVLRESRRIVRQIGPVLITETHHGFVCANAGVDQSSSGAHGRVVVLPSDPDASARTIRARFARLGGNVAVVISDTFGRVWRKGLTDVAIGCAGIKPIADLRGALDSFGRPLEVTEVCIVDELAGAAELVMGKATGTCAAVVRGVDAEWLGRGDVVSEVVRAAEDDLFR